MSDKISAEDAGAFVVDQRWGSVRMMPLNNSVLAQDSNSQGVPPDQLEK